MSLSPACVCHVPIPCSNTDIYWQQHQPLHANADCGWMSGCVYVTPAFMCVWYVNSWDNHSPYPLCHSRNSLPWTVFPSFAESGDTYQRQVLSIFSIASGICLLGVACMALYRRNKWVMPARNTLVEYGPRLCRKSTLLSWHGTQWNSKYESAGGCFSRASDLNCAGCIWDRNPCKIYL